MNLNAETQSGSASITGATRSKITLILGIFIALLAVIPVQADQVTTAPLFGPYELGGGGEFTMIPDAGVAALLSPFYSPFTINQGGYRGSFQTFCVERNEYITDNITYDVTQSSVTIFSAKPLTIGAAYLYQQFAMGTLPYYNYADSPLGSRAGFTANHGTAFELQRAISYFMGEYSYDPYNYYMGAFGVVPLPSGNLFAADNGAHGVTILNLWAPGHKYELGFQYQDVLILTTVPEPSTFALASLGAAALLAFRRRK